MGAVEGAFAAASLWIIDLDGVVWLAGEPIGDVGEAISDLRADGVRIAFATNNSAPTTTELLDRLGRLGIDADPGDLVTSARALASLLEPGQTVSVLAEGGVLEALDDRGIDMVENQPVDAAVVGWSHTFDFDRLASAASAARESGRLLATNEDPTHPTPHGLVPGSGALLAAVATASGVVPEIAGKPHRATVALVESQFDLRHGSSAVLVGDQPGTDGRLAQRLGIPFALVDSGVTAPGTDGVGVPVAIRAPDLVSLIRRCRRAERSPT